MTHAFLWLIGLLAALLGSGVALFRIKYMPSHDALSEIELNPPQMPIVKLSLQERLDLFCGAIRDNEGSPGDRNYRNNNPGNCRCSPVSYLPKYGNVVCVDNFAVFPTYELGWEYLQNLVHYRAELHALWTFYDFFNNYAPAGDKNDPEAYAEFVAKRCSVAPSTSLGAYFG